MNFGSHTDHVVAVAAELVNALTPGRRQGRDYVRPAGAEPLRSAVVAALQPGRSTVKPPALSRLPAFIELAQAIRPVFEADPDAGAALVNDLLARYQPMPYLDQHDGEPWHLHFHGPPAADRSGWGAGISVGLAQVLGSEYADRLGVCQARECDRVYVDVSKNGTRRFCSTSCQNRTKAAAHRARSAGR